MINEVKPVDYYDSEIPIVIMIIMMDIIIIIIIVISTATTTFIFAYKESMLIAYYEIISRPKDKYQA
jgi:hypothetical protein